MLTFKKLLLNKINIIEGELKSRILYYNNPTSAQRTNAVMSNNATATATITITVNKATPTVTLNNNNGNVETIDFRETYFEQIILYATILLLVGIKKCVMI